MRVRRALATGLLTTSLCVPLAAGDVVAVTAEPLYFLPAPAGMELEVSAGNDHPTGRRANEVYAFDFVAPEGAQPGFTVLAARGGTVIASRAGVRDGRCDRPEDGPRPPCWRQVNLVLIDHGDGTSGLYLHLRRGSVTVKNGQVVSRGTPLGRAGRSGWTSETGVQFQVQETPGSDLVGSAGWFLTQSRPLAFGDPSVLESRPDGVPLTGDVVTSANPGAHRKPFRFRRRPLDLPAVVPLAPGEARAVALAYDPDSPDGFGLSFAPTGDVEPVLNEEPAETPQPAEASARAASLSDPGTELRPLFGGELVYAGCATGRSASLGLVVIVRRQLDEHHFDAVHGHLSSIDAALLEEPFEGPSEEPSAASPIEVSADQILGRYGELGPEGLPEAQCPAPDGGPSADPSSEVSREAFVAILEDAEVSRQGEISGGTPVSPEPLVGRGGYEGFRWWAGPVTASAVAREPGRPRGNWHRRATGNGSHVVFGMPVSLVARVRDSSDIREVRFRAFYPGWPRSGPEERPGFDPRTTWRILAVCRPPGSSGEPARTPGCDWRGDARDAVVTYRWDPTLGGSVSSAAWLPRARPAISRDLEACVPVSLAFEVLDISGHARLGRERLPTPSACDAGASELAVGARLVYLDPLVPPRAPGTRGQVTDRAFPPIDPDPLEGRVVWRDRAANEEGYRIYVRRNWLDTDCDVLRGRYVLITTLPADSTGYRPRHQRILRAAPAPEIPDVPGSLTRYEVYVAAFNEAGESARTYVGGFVAGGEGFCDPGLDEPPPGF